MIMSPAANSRRRIPNTTASRCPGGRDLNKKCCMALAMAAVDASDAGGSPGMLSGRSLRSPFASVLCANTPRRRRRRLALDSCWFNAMRVLTITRRRRQLERRRPPPLVELSRAANTFDARAAGAGAGAGAGAAAGATTAAAGDAGEGAGAGLDEGVMLEAGSVGTSHELSPLTVLW